MAKKKIEDYLKENPSYYISPYDIALAAENPDFAAALISAKSQWYGTDDPIQKESANKKLESARALYGGYTGGAEGSEYNPLAGYNQPTTPTTKTPSYEAPSPYVSPYSSAIDTLLNNISNVQPFSYDPGTDPLYSQIKKTQVREGQRAMEDALGRAATMTGGLPSTAAISAASQANDYHLAKLGDAIPQLQQLAYSMYRDNIGDLYNQMGLLRGLESDAYGKYRDTVGDYRYEREYADEMDWRNKQWLNQLAQQYLAEQRYQDETSYRRELDKRDWEYQLGRDAVEDERYERGWEYQLGRDTIEDERYEREYQDRLSQQDIENSLAWQRLQSGGGGGGENFTIDQYLNYLDTYSRLMKDKTPQEAIEFINRRGADEYINLMGEELFQQMLSDIAGTKTQAPKKQDTFGAIYSAMVASGDPEAWLAENAQYLTDEELQYVISILDSLGGGGYGNLG